ncbi:MAG: hypothetical protein LBS42_10550 [Tannerella sp.]|jgi:hypothetical protein|nr:hypothetical protein [Tannerella sp.]
MKHLPEQFDGYAVSEWLDYEGEALYDYINGGAELYLSYGLAGMTGCKYSGEGLPQITAEIYEMTSPANAFGVYTQSRDREEQAYGQGSQSLSDCVLFWKDCYCVVITTRKATPESGKAIHRLAALIDSAIPGTGDRPAIVNALPQKNLTPGGYIYFHHYIWLNAYLFIADYNIVNISDQTHAVLAKYGNPDERCYLLLVEYPDAAGTEAACRQLKDKFAPESTDPRAKLQLEDGTWFMTWTRNKHLYAIFNSNSSEQIEDLYQSIINN